MHLKDRVKPKTENFNEVRLHFDNETIEMLGKLKSLWPHAMPNATYSDLFKRMIYESMRRHDPIKKAERSQKTGKSWIKHQTSMSCAQSKTCHQRLRTYKDATASWRSLTHQTDCAGVSTFKDFLL